MSAVDPRGEWTEGRAQVLSGRFRLRDAASAPEGTPALVEVRGVDIGNPSDDPAAAGTGIEYVLTPLPFGEAVACDRTLFEALYQPDVARDGDTAAIFEKLDALESA
ncbi:hypothetical protein [Patulibacter sp.]|uniref:hypothetical protein n=1 Tax=Patulibacter sp. TaxID=1912859 RepID=UPI002718FF4E|nr:hypothetical protein [Patulibacter sp.]MDO9409685.1 hypothetical protein [Patulibacter sp.]